jgi:hypothetical protein
MTMNGEGAPIGEGPREGKGRGDSSPEKKGTVTNFGESGAAATPAGNS